MSGLAIACPRCGQPLESPEIKALALALLEPKPAWPGRPVMVTNEEKAVLFGRGGDKEDAMPESAVVVGVTVPGSGAPPR